MATYDPIVPRPKDGSRRASGSLPDSLQRALYQEMLTEELGRSPEGFVAAEPEREWREILPAIFAMMSLAIVVLGLAYVVMLWRAGEFDSWASGRTVTPAQRAWQRADRAQLPIEAAPERSQMEDMLQKPRAVVEEESEEASVEAEE